LKPVKLEWLNALGLLKPDILLQPVTEASDPLDYGCSVLAAAVERVSRQNRHTHVDERPQLITATFVGPRPPPCRDNSLRQDGKR